MVIKYTKIFHSKALQNLPKSGFLVWKQTIWQPWLESENAVLEFLESILAVADGQSVTKITNNFINIGLCGFIVP
jgi:hypothetical protein